MYWNHKDLPEGFGLKLEAQAANLEVVECHVDDRSTGRDSAALSNKEANDSNQRWCEYLSAAPAFFEDHVSEGGLVADHSDLTSEERAAHVMLFDGLDFTGKHKLQQYWHSAFSQYKCDAPILMQIIHLFSQDEYFHHESGLQLLLSHLSIRNEFDDVPLTGREAFLQKKELLHLNHVNAGGKANRGRDANPYNTAFGNHPSNLCGQSCAKMITRVCKCPIRCIPRHYLVTPAYFEQQVQIELVKAFGRCPGLNEVQIRRKFRQEYKDFFTRWDKAAPAFLESDNLLRERYQILSNLRPRIDFSLLEPGIYCERQRCRVTFTDIYSGRRDMPDGFLSTLQTQLSTLEPVACLVNSDAEWQAYANKQNLWVFQRVLGIYSIYARALESKLVSDIKDITTDERAAGALFVDGATKGNSPQLDLCDGKSWGKSTVVNAYFKSLQKKMMPTAANVVKYAQLYFDYNSMFEARGGVEAFLRFVSILGPDDGLPGFLVKPQMNEASHLYHTPTGLRAARDCNPENVVPECMDSNLGRASCSVDPTSPCLGECQCRPQCKPAIFKLTEERFNDTVSAEFLNGPFGQHPGMAKSVIRSDLVGRYRRAYEVQGVAVPLWLEARRDESIQGGQNHAWFCDKDNCNESFATLELALRHESTCGTTESASEGDNAVAATQDTRAARTYTQFLCVDDAELFRLIRKEGWGNWSVMTKAFRTCIPTGGECLRKRAVRSNDFQVYCTRQGANLELLKECKGTRRGSCTCDLHLITAVSECPEHCRCHATQDSSAVPDTRVERTYAQFFREDDEELLRLIKEEGWRNWAAIRNAFTTCIPTGSNCVRKRVFKSRDFRAYCTGQGVTFEQLEECEGTRNECICDLH